MAKRLSGHQGAADRVARPDDDQPAMRGRYAAWHLRAAVAAALRRLGVERIDPFQLHGRVAAGVDELD